jgi:hypothetical protein
MARYEEKHIGRRENVWLPKAEHEKMLTAMSAAKETNKSSFVRTAVRAYARYILYNNATKPSPNCPPFVV